MERNVEELLRLLRYKGYRDMALSDLEPSERAEDYETGSAIRSGAALELAKTGDPKLVADLAELLYDMGDAAGCSEGRAVFYFSGGREIQKSAARALATMEVAEAIKALERKLEDVESLKRRNLSIPYHGATEIDIIEALGESSHPRAQEVLMEIFNQDYLSTTYSSGGDLEKGFAAAESLKKQGVHVERVLLERGYNDSRAYRKGKASKKVKDYDFSDRCWRGTVVSFCSEPVRDVRISTTFVDSGRAYTFSKTIDKLEPGERAEFELRYSPEKEWIETDKFSSGDLHIVWNETRM